jgi:hypothetical protein
MPSVSHAGLKDWEIQEASRGRFRPAYERSGTPLKMFKFLQRLATWVPSKDLITSIGTKANGLLPSALWQAKAVEREIVGCSCVYLADLRSSPLCMRLYFGENSRFRSVAELSFQSAFLFGLIWHRTSLSFSQSPHKCSEHL